MPTVVQQPSARHVQEAVRTASGTFIDLSRESTEEPSRRYLQIGQAAAWQVDTEYFMCEIGQVWYAFNYVGDRIGQLGWYLGWEDPSGKVIPARNAMGAPTNDAIPADLLAAGVDAIDRLASTSGGHADWARPMGTFAASVAEGWLVGYHRNDDGDPVPGEIQDDQGVWGENPDAVEEVWEAFSPTGVRRSVADPDAKDTTGKEALTVEVMRSALNAGPSGSNSGQWQKLPADTVMVHIWRRGARPDDADGPMVALIQTCEDILMFQQGIRGSALSRTHAGLLLIPHEGLGAPMPAGSVIGGGDQNGTGPNLHPVVSSIVAGLITPAKNPGSAAALVPSPVTTAGDRIEQWTHLPLSRDIDPALSALIEAGIRSFAQGNNLPPEILLGLGDSNHWSAWQIGADAWRHIEPTAVMIRDGMTAGYLWPLLRASVLDGVEDGAVALTPEARAEIKRFRFCYDPTKVLVDPDKSDDADAMLAAGVISEAAYRRYKGVPESDKPTEDELIRRRDLGLNKAMGTPAPPGGNQIVQGPPASPNPAEGSARSAVVVAAGNPDTIGLTRRLADLDLAHLTQTVFLTDHAVSEAVAQAGAQLRSRAQKDPSLRAALAGRPAHEVGLTIGPRAASRLFAEDDGDTIEALFAAAMVTLLGKYRTVSDATFAEYVRTVSAHTGVSLTVAEAAAYAENVVASEAVLRTGVTDLARARLFDQAAHAITDGEAPAGVSVPSSVSRRASARAGGVNISGGVGPLERYEGGFATGPESLDILGSRGLVKNGLLWDYGSTASRKEPFLPHHDLNGITFEGEDDPALDVCPWGMAFPGDHAGCQCTWSPTFEVI